MYIARVLYPIKVLGPGDRIGIWFNGCKHFCKGCSNPELWEKNEKYKTDINRIMSLVNSIVNTHKVDGFVLTGGDPLEQPDALRELLPRLYKCSTDILLYTGYEYNSVKEMYSDIFNYIAVVIDGEYIEEKNNGSILKGSSNQNIIVLNKKYRSIYDDYVSNSKSEIQNFNSPTGVISVGIHRPGYNEEIDELLQKKGLKKYE